MTKKATWMRTASCVHCGTPFSKSELKSMSKFLGWRLGSNIVRSDGSLHMTLLDLGARASFSVSARGGGLDAQLVSASFRLDVPPETLDKFRCGACTRRTPLGTASCLVSA